MKDNNSQIDVSIVAPAFCEGSLVLDFFNAVSDVMNNAGILYEIIVVDDCSTDDTWKYISDFCAKNENARGIRLNRNAGSEKALLAGMKYASGQFIVTMDSDLQHPPELIPKMYEMIKDGGGGADIIDCIKMKRHPETIIQKCFTRAFHFLFYKLTAVDLKNASNFKMFNQKAVKSLIDMEETDVFLRWQVHRIGLKILSLPFLPKSRKSGSTKYSFMNSIQMAVTFLTAWSSKPLLIIHLFSFLFAALSIFVFAGIVALYASKIHIELFWFFILFFCITAAFLFFCMSLISLYLDKIFREVKARPKYIISQTCGWDKQENQKKS
ncbi:MAG: glycosyltransferase family 2 protein [Elusimicrobiota bacterium]|jgi:glycosyltransferase involved in cell wall biosynthesis|nr:glycosyltransferase family 2 protein [Elusimicrobiota bacterium]